MRSPKYRQYDEDGNEQLGEYGKMFEEEYFHILNQYLTLENTPYQQYLRKFCREPSAVHKGYFSIDKRPDAASTARRSAVVSSRMISRPMT